MTSTVILNDFKAPQLWRNKYRRSTYQIWDANLHHGDVRPFACPELICDDSFQTLFISNNCECGGFDTYRKIVKGFCDNSYYVIDNELLRQTTSDEICIGAQTFAAGSPIPPTPNLLNGDCNDSCDNAAWSYLITYVVEHNGMLIEGPPSQPIGVTTANIQAGITIGWPAASGTQLDYNIVATRLYRTETTFEDGMDSISPQGSEWVFVDEFVGAIATQHIDFRLSEDTGGPLTTYDPMIFPAPRERIVGLARTTDGIVVAERHRVFISESGKPMFTFDGVVDIEDEVQEIVAINNTIFVFTDNKPVKIGYRHTDGVMSIDRQVIERRLPLTSRESVSVYDNRVYFASSYSLYVWDTGAYGNDLRAPITQLLTPEQWANLDPTTITGTAYEFGYIFSSAKINYSLMIEFGGDGTDTFNATSIMPISFINPTTFALDDDGHIVYSNLDGTYRWDWRRVVTPFSPPAVDSLDIQDHVRPSLSDQCDCCPWTIRMYFDNEGKNRFSKMRVEWDERSATHLDARFYLKAFGNEQEITDTLKIIRSRGFSIPKFCSSQTFCVEVAGCGIMHEIRMATSSEELVSSSNNLIGNPGE